MPREQLTHVHQEARDRMPITELFAQRRLGDALPVCGGRGLPPSECGRHPWNHAEALFILEAF